jgi:hypothetical protein
MSQGPVSGDPQEVTKAAYAAWGSSLDVSLIISQSDSTRRHQSAVIEVPLERSRRSLALKQIVLEV